MSKNIKVFFSCLMLILTSVISAPIACMHQSVALSGLTSLDPENVYWSKGVRSFLDGDAVAAIKCFSLAESSLKSSGRRWNDCSIICNPQQLGLVLLDKASSLASCGKAQSALESLLFIVNNIPSHEIASLATKKIIKLKLSHPTLRQLKWWGSPETNNIKTCIRASCDNFSKVMLSTDEIIFIPSSIEESIASAEIERFYNRLFPMDENISEREIKTNSNTIIIKIEKAEFDNVRKLLTKHPIKDEFDFTIKHPLYKKPNICFALDVIVRSQKYDDLFTTILTIDEMVGNIINPYDSVGSHEDIMVLFREFIATLAKANESDPIDLSSINSMLIDYVSYHNLEIRKLLFEQQYTYQKINEVLLSEYVLLSPKDEHALRQILEHNTSKAITFDMGNCSAIVSSQNGWGIKAIRHIINACKRYGIDSNSVSLTPSLNLIVKGNKEEAEKIVMTTKQYLLETIVQTDKNSHLYGELLAIFSVLS